MKSKLLLLSLLAAAGLVAADTPPGAPAGTTPPADAPDKGEKGDKHEKDGEKPEKRKGGPLDVPGIGPEEMKKYQEAKKAAAELPEVKATRENGKPTKAYYDALSAAIVKADPSLAEVDKKYNDFMKARNKKAKGPKKPEGDAPAAAPAAGATAPAETK